MPFLPSSWRRPHRSNAMRDAISYIRVSSEEQDDSGPVLETDSISFHVIMLLQERRANVVHSAI
jgi:hypothetical protein